LATVRLVTVRLVAAGAAGVELVSANPRRRSFIVQNVSDSEIVSIYNKPGKENEGIYLYAHTWLQFQPADEPQKQWYCYSTTGGTTNLHLIEFFEEAEKAARY